MNNNLRSLKQKSRNYLFTFTQLPLRHRVTKRAIAEFTKGLAVLLIAKIPLANALATLQKQTESKQLKIVITGLSRSITKGLSLADAMKAHPQVFDLLYVYLVRIGESSSNLGQVLLWHSSYLERMYLLQQKILLSLIYPAILVLASLSAAIFFLLFIFPAITEVFSEFGAQLPWGTRWMLAVGRGIPIIILFTGIVLISISYYFTRGKKRNTLHNVWEVFLLRAPIVATLLRKVFVSRFCRSLGLLLKSGNTISGSLEICVATISNSLLRKKMHQIMIEIEKGTSISIALSRTSEFPEMVCQMISVGEETANLTEVLTYIADFYEKEMDASVDAISSMIEPIIIIIVGIFIAFIIVTMYLPLFDLVNVLDY